AVRIWDGACAGERRTERRCYARRDGRLESRRAAPRSTRGRRLRLRLRDDVIGFSTMNGGIDRRATPDNYLIDSYDLVTQLAPLIVEHQGKGTMSAVLLEPKDPPQKIQLGNYTLQVAFMRPRAARRGDPPPEPPTLAGAMFIATGPD